MNFHSMTPSCLFNLVQVFRKRSQICFFRNISENENLLVLTRPVRRGRSPHYKTLFALLEKCVGHSLKIPRPRKLFTLSGVPSWLRVCF